MAIRKAQLYEKQREEFMATIKVLITAIEAKDAYTEGIQFVYQNLQRLLRQKLVCHHRRLRTFNSLDCSTILENRYR